MLNIDDDDIHDMIFSNIDYLIEMGHNIKEPDDKDLTTIWNEIYNNFDYEDEDDLEEFIIDLIFKYLK